MASSGTSSVPTKEKPVVVRVKRKVSQESLDAFWLEINGRPLKKPFLGFENLSISDHESKVLETLKTKRLLVQHVETVSPFEAIEDILQSLLHNSNGSENFMSKIEVRKSQFKKEKKQVRSLVRQKHEELTRSARYEQIWKSRRGEADSLREFCQIYDVVRVDSEDEAPRNKKDPQHISAEENAILCNYLPLLREYIPSAAEDMESEMKAYLFSEEGSGSDATTTATKEGAGLVPQATVGSFTVGERIQNQSSSSVGSFTVENRTDEYVYDLYTVEEKCIETEEDLSCNYPSVQVKDEEDDIDDVLDSEYDSDDSNAEAHPRNDYPDEESSGVEEEDELDPFGDLECPNSDYEDEIASNSKTDDDEASNTGSNCSDSQNEGEDSLRWGYR